MRRALAKDLVADSEDVNNTAAARPADWVPSRFTHRFLAMRDVRYSEGYDVYYSTEACTVSAEEATLVSSEITGGPDRGKHTVMIDIDLPVTALPSGTAGHFHLYIDHPIRWRAYKRLLRAHLKAGLIDRSYYRAAVRHRATHLRPPWLLGSGEGASGTVQGGD